MICSNGQAKEMECPDTMQFNIKEKICDIPDKMPEDKKKNGRIEETRAPDCHFQILKKKATDFTEETIVTEKNKTKQNTSLIC